MKRATCFLTLVACLSNPLMGAGAPDILIADFEGSDYGDWKVTGEAFGPRPARGTLPGQMNVTGFKGKGLANTYYQGDGSIGTATSPRFVIQRQFINFLIGGGKNPGQTCINLRIGGQAVRSATGPNDRPGGSEKLDWASWDVGEFRGKNAVLEIVDNHTGGWGHINIDHILQSDTNHALPISDLTRTLTITQPYLNLPVTTGLSKRWMRLSLQGDLVREFNIEYAEENEAFWVFVDTREFMGKDLILTLDGQRGGDAAALDRVIASQQPKDAETFYKERLRQQFHFTSRRGWNNDSNGLVYYNGQYHLFYQHNPYGWAWGNMTWGHAVSRDMIHWQELRDALHPDALGTIYSGSAVVDKDNTSGFKQGQHDPLVCFYTSAANNPWARQAGSKFAQSIAYSHDSGQTWTKYRDNPVISHIIGGNRDPKVLWHEPTGRWVMALFLDKREMAFFSSPDLKQWTEESRWTDCQYECPEFFEMAIDGDPSQKKWVFYGGSGDYYVGGFDGKRFTPESDLIKFHHGNCFYASQTFSNMPDGRRVQIAWGRVATRGMPFNQCMLFPVDLTLHATEQGERLRVNPIPEIESLHRKTHASQAFTLEAGQKRTLNGSGNLFHIKAEFVVNAPGSFGLRIHGREIFYDARQNQLTCLGKTASLKPINRRIELEILVDRTTLEIFANQGRVYMPMGTIPEENDRGLEVFSRDGSVRAESIVVHELSSIWR